MPLYPVIDNDDVLACGTMLVIVDLPPNGMCVIPSPIAGRLKAFTVCLQSSTNANIVLTLSTKHGTFATTFTIPNGTAIGTLTFDVPMYDRANYVDAGEPFIFSSDGGGSAGGLAQFIAIIGRG